MEQKCTDILGHLQEHNAMMQTAAPVALLWRLLGSAAVAA